MAATIKHKRKVTDTEIPTAAATLAFFSCGMRDLGKYYWWNLESWAQLFEGRLALTRF